MAPHRTVLRTPDERFRGLPGFAFEPRYTMVADDMLGPLRMHYLDEGPADGPVVLMLHGNPTWSFLYRHMIGPVAAAGYRVVVPDMIGFGRSDKPIDRDAYGYDRFTGWMRAFIDALALEGITLVCQDWGGPIGLRLLGERPDRFAAVLATNTLLPNCEPPPRGIADWPGAGIEAWIETCRTQDDLSAGELVRGASATVLDPAIVAAYDAPFPDKRYKAGLHQITGGIPTSPDAEGVAANRAAWEVLEGWRKPFLTAFSDGDPATAPWADLFRRRVAGARGLDHPIVAGAGHFVQEEAGDRLAAILLALLGSEREGSG